MQDIYIYIYIYIIINRMSYVIYIYIHIYIYIYICYSSFTQGIGEPKIRASGGLGLPGFPKGVSQGFLRVLLAL